MTGCAGCYFWTLHVHQVLYKVPIYTTRRGRLCVRCEKAVSCTCPRYMYLLHISSHMSHRAVRRYVEVAYDLCSDSCTGRSMNSSTGQAAPPEMAYRSLDGIATVPYCCAVLWPCLSLFSPPLPLYPLSFCCASVLMILARKRVRRCY